MTAPDTDRLTEPLAVEMPVIAVLTGWRDGDEHGWPTEFKWLDENRSEELLALTASVEHEGFKNPVLLGDDGRVWDGHHRLRVALILKAETIPVEFAALRPTIDALLTERGERTWDEGYKSGWSNAMRRMSDEPHAPITPNPYRIARQEARRD
jgi:hypothetical protein